MVTPKNFNWFSYIWSTDPKLCSDKSESGGKWLLFSHWLKILKMLGISQWEIRMHFPTLSDLSEHSFGISGQNLARISWNFECYQFFILRAWIEPDVEECLILIRFRPIFQTFLVLKDDYDYFVQVCTLSMSPLSHVHNHENWACLWSVCLHLINILLHCWVSLFSIWTEINW